MKLGKSQILKIKNITKTGAFLADENEETCFLPNIFVSNQSKEGDEVEVLVYQEKENLRATTEKPLCEVGEFAVMTCIQTLPSGAFLDWGIIKDLFVPYKQQKGKMLEGKRYLVYVYIDEETGLVIGTTKFKRNPQYHDISLKKGDKVDLILMNETELGWNAVINQKYIGLIYNSDVYKKLYPLSEEVGYIKNIREDGKIDISLQPEGYESIDVFKQNVLDKLNENYGILYLSDQSTPEEIKHELQMSKKNFKKAIGRLYKEKKIEIEEDKIILK